MHRILAFVIVTLMVTLVMPPAGAQISSSIQIVSPRNDATISGTQVVVEVRVQNFYLNPLSIGKPARPGEGYWEVSVDGKYAGISADEVASFPNDALPALDPGRHTIKAELRNNDHTSVAGAESSEVSITIPPKSAMRYTPPSGQPGIKIMVPHNHASVSPYLIVWVKIKGFKQQPRAVGTAAKSGEGYWRLYVDGRMAGISTSSVADVQMTRGKHVLGVSLRNNDHSPVKGASSDQVTVTVH